MTKVDSPELVDTAYAAAYLHKSIWTIHRWLNTGKLPAVKLGQTWYIRKDRLEQMLDPLSTTQSESGSIPDATTASSGAASGGRSRGDSQVKEQA